MSTVFFVEDIGKCPGRIWAVFASKDDAEKFAKCFTQAHEISTHVVERTVFYGQPHVLGFNK